MGNEFYEKLIQERDKIIKLQNELIENLMEALKAKDIYILQLKDLLEDK